MPLQVVAISDTHGRHSDIDLPDGDVLLHAGDFCTHGRADEVMRFVEWLETQPHAHKIVTAGNHDIIVEREPDRFRRVFKDHGVTLLLNEEVVIDGVKFWGSPVTPQFFNWAFMLDRGPPIQKIWEQIPDDVDVLVTHGPAYGHGDLCPPYRTAHRKVAGCLDLLNKIRTLHDQSGGKHPKVHVFGHIHDGYGATQSDTFGSLVFINAATCTERYRPDNKPIVFEVG